MIDLLGLRRTCHIALYFFTLWHQLITPLKAAPEIDPVWIPRAEEVLLVLEEESIARFLVDRNFSRPERCPLRSDSEIWNIHSRLALITQALKDGKCYEENAAMIDGMSPLLSEGERLFSLPRSDYDHETEPDPELNQSNQLQKEKVLSFLNTATSSEACLMDVKKKGLLPVLADVATNVGQVSSLMPTPNGFLLGAGGVSVGSILRIFNGLFRARFNWDLPEERNQFLDLNCSFYDLRRDIESAEILDAQDELIEDKINIASESLRRLGILLTAQREEKSKFLNHLDQMISRYHSDELGVEHLQIISIGNQASSIIASTDQTRGWQSQQANIIFNFASLFPDMISLLENKLPHDSRYHQLLSIMKRFDWQDLDKLYALDEIEFKSRILAPFEVHLRDLLDHLNINTDSLSDDFYRQIHTSDPSISNRDIIDRVEESYENIFSGLLVASRKIETRLQVLSSKDRKERFSKTDDGAHSTFDIIEEYRYIQEMLTGKLGYSYMKFFRSKLKFEKRSFKKFYKKFRQNYFENLKLDDRKQISWACRDANQLRVIWEHASSSAEVANDFIDTNIGLFHTNVKKFRTLYYIVPFGLSSNYKLLRAVKGAEYIKSVIIDDRQFEQKAIEEYNHFYHKNFGKLFGELHSTENQRQFLENFWKEHRCLSYN